MLAALLGSWRYLLYAGIVAAVIGALVYAKGQYDDKLREEGAIPYIIAIEKNRRQAELLLQAETERANKITQAWIDDARKSENDYQKKIAAIRNAPIAGGLYDPARRWQSGNCPESSQDSTGASENPAESTRLSGVAEQFLYAEAKRADEVMAWAMSCYSFVNGE
jgi:hypothetical protein